MNAEKMIEELKKLPADTEMYAKNDKGLYRRVEKIATDDNYPDAMIYAGDVE